MSDGTPALSVVIPVHDGARTLARAIDSVLAQSARVPMEIIVVDDASRDASADIARAYPEVRLVQRSASTPDGGGAGPAVARNLGIRHARAELIAFNDADDAWLPNKLELQLGLLAARPELDFVLCAFENVADDGFELAAWAVREHPGEAMPGFIFQAMLAHRRAFDRIGLLDEHMRWAEDTDWFLRARDEGLAMLRTQVVGVHRFVHDTNLTAQVRESQRGLVRAIHASMQRRKRRANEGA